KDNKSVIDNPTDSVRYHELNMLMLMEIQEHEQKINDLQKDNDLMKASLCKLGELQWC
ncbi:unnamed protein product, partial [marine sediment metagenome]